MTRESTWIRTAASGAAPALSAAPRREAEMLDAGAVCELAFAHQIAPWLLAALSASGDPLPSLAVPLRQIALQQTGLALAHEAVLRRLLEGLGRRGVEMLILKGPALARSYYPQVGLRPYRDLDVLVREADVPALSGLLEEAGYLRKDDEPSSRIHRDHGRFQEIYTLDSTMRVEIHCDHLQVGIEPVGMDEIWVRAERIEIGGQSVLALEAHDLFVHLCLHLHRHSFSRLIWFKDLDLLVRQGRLDWACVRERATAQGCVDSVALSLALLEAVLGTPLPSEAQTLAASRARWVRWLHRVFWPERRSLDLEVQRRWRLRRLVQFAPEGGVIRGGLPSLLFTGRRRAKLRVLAAGLPGRRRR